MIKQDILKHLAQELKINERESLVITDAIIDSVREVIVDQGRLEMRGFGSFHVRERKGKVGRNPRNREEFPIHAHNVVIFKAGKAVRDAILKGKRTGSASRKKKPARTSPLSDI